MLATSLALRGIMIGAVLGIVMAMARGEDQAHAISTVIVTAFFGWMIGRYLQYRKTGG